ncbi:hypothetical protein AB0G15_01300 [Streptosporangium sp. NPDC023825]|uniref:hypothetical protein n=1 Tax=Streptosporangium sp. NPDC023825 TaxID=3154909 RepID=UPI003428CBCF
MVLDASGVLSHTGLVDRAGALSGPIDAVAQEFPAGTGHLANEERSPVGGGGAAPAHPALPTC